MAKSTIKPKADSKPKGKTNSKPSKEKPVIKEEVTPTLEERHKEYIETITPEETIVERKGTAIEIIDESTLDQLPPPAIEEPTPHITHKFVKVEGLLGRVEYSDGSSELMTEQQYQKLDIRPKNPIESTPIVKSKAELDLEAHYASLGQIDYYFKHVKK